MQNNHNPQPPTPSGSQGFLFLIIVNQHFPKVVVFHFKVYVMSALRNRDVIAAVNPENECNMRTEPIKSTFIS